MWVRSSCASLVSHVLQVSNTLHIRISGINRLFAYCKAVTLIFISGRCSASSPAKQEKSGSIYNLVKN